jgi:hypothetical protein
MLSARVGAADEIWSTETSRISYGAERLELTRRAAAYIDKILKGANPADLPMEQASKYELVINLKTAKAFGMTIPPLLLARADSVLVQIRVGLNSGEVVVRSIGSDMRMDYTAVGQTTHLAARMEQMAAAGPIQLAADTLRLSSKAMSRSSR